MVSNPRARLRQLTRQQLRELTNASDGVVLVDHLARGRNRPSTLHAVDCKWVKMTGAKTPLRFERSLSEATQWLDRERGEEGDGWQLCPDCAAESLNEERASLPAEDRTGETVWAQDQRRTLAWITSSDDLEVQIAEFDSPGRDAEEGRLVSIDDVERFEPHAGDRCFVDRTGAWEAGSFVDQTDGGKTTSVEINGESLEIPTSKVRFRRLAPLGNPLGELGDGRAGSSTRFLARLEFQKRYANLAGLARGLRGVFSASVDLYPHQIGVARRVLADPVQRYLLADEVGLGKTIEAAFVIRQRLIDAPRSVVVVLVPQALVWQWKKELEDKFGLSRFHSAVQVVGFESDRAFKWPLTPDLVVIDEAHRIAAGSNSSVGELARRYEEARQLAHRVPRLLLLSATPALHREEDLLAMLHLLDPDSYQLEDVKAFKKRVAKREQVGELVLAIRPEAPQFLVKSRLPALRKAFNGDSRMQSLIGEIEEGIGDETRRESAMATARVHVNEVYRLHRRLLRNRRSALGGIEFPVRGRKGVTFLRDGDSRRKSVEGWLDRLRTSLLADALEKGEGDSLSSATDAFVVWFAAATGDLEVVRDIADFRLTRKKLYKAQAGLTPEQSAAVLKVELTTGLRSVLGELTELLGEREDQQATRMQWLANRLKKEVDGEAVVVFASAPATVGVLGDALKSTGATVFTYGEHKAEDRAETIARFEKARGTRYFVTDVVGEEGINLQFADQIVHTDTPLSTTRMEQRIGRVDRHGTGRRSVIASATDRCWLVLDIRDGVPERGGGMQDEDVDLAASGQGLQHL